MLGIFSSLIDNYKTKIRNPFIATFVSVWIIRNWSIVYAFFMFDDNCSMEYKKNYISNYFHKQPFWSELALNLLVVFGVLFLTLTMYAISRALTNSYYDIAEPWIINLIKRKEVVTREDKKRLLKEIENLNLALESSRENNSKIEARNRIILDEKQKAIVEFQEKILKMSNDTLKLSKSIESGQKSIKKETKILEAFDKISGKFDNKFKNHLLMYIKNDDILKFLFEHEFDNLQTTLRKQGIILESEKQKNTTITTLFLAYYLDKYNDDDFPLSA